MVAKGVSSLNTDLTLTYNLGKKVTGSGNSYLEIFGRYVSDTQMYRSKVVVSPAGVVRVGFVRVSGTSTGLGDVNVPGLVHRSGDELEVRTVTEGTAPTTLKVEVWPAGATEPSAWNLERTDGTDGRSDTAVRRWHRILAKTRVSAVLTTVVARSTRWARPPLAPGT